jgi:hypothetical protein
MTNDEFQTFFDEVYTASTHLLKVEIRVKLP